ncbi:zinc-binding dehydrogenase [Microbacterium profundi]|uniref:Zinc-binding dehydrogenase n=1 Tax=Microbacterium profundi TaxID=450380 RepID=A0ABV3LD69_9MICO
MLATYLFGPGDVRVLEVADPQILRPTDVIVEVEAACVCGSDLWGYRGVLSSTTPLAKGHEFIGTIVETGSDVHRFAVGDFVIAPFTISDGVCQHCRNGVHPSCTNRGRWGQLGADGLIAGGGQAELVRVPLADGTLTKTHRPSDPAMLRHLLTLTDVMCTGFHAAVCADVTPGDTVVVVGDGAVGLCGVIAAQRLGAEHIIMMSRHSDRQALAREFGATEIVAERGKAGVAAIKELTNGFGADAVLECVGTEESFTQALSSVRPGGQMGFVGLPAGGASAPISSFFARNVGVRGGAAPVLRYIDGLLTDVLDGSITPGRVFDSEFALEDTPDAWAAMDARTSIKSLVLPRRR